MEQASAHAPDLDDIALFYRVCGRLSEDRTLSAVAKALVLPKSTLSRRMSRLEERLGVSLFHRGKALELTEAGAMLRARCGTALQQLEDAAHAVTRATDGDGGRIRVAVPNDYGVLVCAPLFAPFLLQHPGVSIELECAERTVDLTREKIDLAIRVGKIAEQSLIARRVGRIPGVLVASPTYLLRHGTPREPDDLHTHSCLVFDSPPFSARWELTGGAGRTKAVEVQGALTSTSLPVIRDAAVAGLGVARLPEYVCAEALGSERLHRVLPEWSAGERPVHLVYRTGRLPRRVRLLVRHLLGCAGEGAFSRRTA